MDEIAQIMAAKLEQQARLMPPDIDQTLGLDADSSLEWQNGSLSLEGDEEASASSPPAPQQVKPGSRKASKRGDKPRTKEIPFQDLPKVAIVGRPNVGKSALFNRITGSATAIVYDYPGVTRDRLYTRAYWGNTEFVVVDTGGLMGDASKLDADISAAAMHAISAEGLPEAIERQAAAGVAEADCIVLVMDGQTGLTATDQEIVSWLRRSHPNKPVMLAINKCENPQKADIQVPIPAVLRFFKGLCGICQNPHAQLWRKTGTITRAVDTLRISSLIQPAWYGCSLCIHAFVHMAFVTVQSAKGSSKWAVLLKIQWNSSPLQPYSCSCRRQTSGLWVWSPLRFLLSAAAAQAS